MENLKEGKWLVGFSTGPDSMALVEYCLQEKIEIACAFVNYHHRKQADQEEAYARAYCKEKGIVLHVLNDPFDDTIGNFEDQARIWRYAFFVDLVNTYKYQGVLLGHHLDDFLETYFMQVEKKIIPTSFGLQKESDYQGIRVVRPLLSYTKQELIDYLDQNKIPYFIDHTNFDTSLKRNYYRIEVLSNYSKKEKLDLKKEIDKINDLLQEKRKIALGLISNQEIPYDDYIQQEEDVRLFALRYLLEPTPIKKRKSKKYFQELDQIIVKKNDFLIDVVVDGKEFYLTKVFDCICLKEKVLPYSYTIHSIDELNIIKSPYFKIEKGNPSVYAVSVKPSDFPLTIRSARDGDAILQRFGTKKVSRYFIDRKVSYYERLIHPVVVNAEGKVILVPEIGCDPSHYSTSPTFNVLQWSVYSRRKEITNE